MNFRELLEKLGFGHKANLTLSTKGLAILNVSHNIQWQVYCFLARPLKTWWLVVASGAQQKQDKSIENAWL